MLFIVPHVTTCNPLIRGRCVRDGLLDAAFPYRVEPGSLQLEPADGTVRAVVPGRARVLTGVL